MKGNSATEIKEQLDRVLAWSAFQNSRRYPRFLKFIVNKTLEGATEDIKERVIGVEVFGRPLNYETATDPVVRLVAGEIRKRLAQYYVQPEHEHEIRIEIPLGSYVPLFHWPQNPLLDGSYVEKGTVSLDDDSPTPDPIELAGAQLARPHSKPIPRKLALSRKRWISGALAIFLASTISILSSLFWWRQLRPQSILNTFWAPLLATGPSTLICVGDWTATATGLRDALNRQQQQGINFVGPYDLGALARMVSLLGKRDRKFSILLSSRVTLDDLRSKPGILIGSGNNRWTPAVLVGTRFRFRFEPGNDANILVDTQEPKTKTWSNGIDSSQLGMKVGQDVGLIARIVSPTTGQVELVVAGSSTGGTTAASEFITNPEYFKQIASYAPRGWESRNDIEMIVTTDVINGSSGPPRLIRFYAR
ncbi:MAG: hypothetical protein ACLGQU_12475 [Acidobacteriota bacterium]